MRLLLAAALVALSAPAFAQSVLPVNDIITGAIEDYIRPNFHRFAEEASSFATKVDALCTAPSADALTEAQNRFRSMVIAFSRIEFIRIGPLSKADRLERLLFWPDRKGIALRQVQAALADKDETAADPATLADKSVAMQGMAAVEYLLFGSGADALGTGDDYRCRYAHASAALIADLAATLDKEWADPMGQSDHMLSPQPTYDDFRTQTEVLEKLAATLIHGTETIRDQRLMPILSDGKPKPKSALFWRSDMTARALAANFGGLHEYFVAARYPQAVGPTNAWVANGAEFELDNAVRAAGVITSPMEQAVLDEEQLKALKYMMIITGSLDTILGQNLAAALGLSVGFSALDGD